MAKRTSMKVETSPVLMAQFRLKRETKGALLYEEIDDNGEPTINLSGSIYLRKSALGAERPETITLSVSW